MTRRNLTLVTLLLAAYGAILVAESHPTPVDLPDPHYRYARVERVVDGDTIDLSIEHSFAGVTYWQRGVRVRVLGIDTPEVRGESREAGLEATQTGEAWLKRCAEDNEDGWPLLVRSTDSDSFGRALASITCRATGGDYARHMLVTGNAKGFEG